MKIVKKVWGEELWVVNNKKYCGKILTVNKGFRCSLHYHKNKHETFYVLQGSPLMEIDGKVIRAIVGEVFEIIPRTLHRFSAPNGEVKLIEFSTHHEDSDSYREVLSGKMINMKISCELCKLYVEDDIKTRFYFKTSLITVVDCLTGGEGHPMAVFCKHNKKPTKEEDAAIERECREYFYAVEGKEISFRNEPQKVMNHTHYHIVFKEVD